MAIRSLSKIFKEPPRLQDSQTMNPDESALVIATEKEHEHEKRSLAKRFLKSNTRKEKKYERSLEEFVLSDMDGRNILHRAALE